MATLIFSQEDFEFENIPELNSRIDSTIRWMRISGGILSSRMMQLIMARVYCRQGEFYILTDREKLNQLRLVLATLD